MKMITAIVNKKDTDLVCEALGIAGFTFTKMASTGGFLRSGNTTLLIGIEDHRIPEAMDIIRKNCKQRVVDMPVPALSESATPLLYPPTAKVTVGGATVFITNVELFEKM